MSEFTGTFTNWDETPSELIPPGNQARRGKRSPPATDLHIKFKKRGVECTTHDKSQSVTQNMGGNTFDFTFPTTAAKPSAPWLPWNGDPAAPPKQPPAESSFSATFKRNGTEPPEIETWWWTHTEFANGKVVKEHVAGQVWKGYRDYPPFDKADQSGRSRKAKGG